MTICLAQVRSTPGDLAHNIRHHLALLGSVAPGTADLVVFPELSLTNYEPTLAASTAITHDDPRLEVFQRVADRTGIAVAVGAPLKTSGKPAIGLLAFVPGKAVVVICKQYLHPDEESFFSAGDGGPYVLDLSKRVGVAICYELSVPAHVEAVMAQRPDVYLASVAKTPAGVAAATQALASTAQKHGVPVLLVNSVGTCEGKPAGGGSLALDRQGRCIQQLGPASEDLLMVRDV